MYPWYYEQIDLSFNFILPDINAALGLSQLKNIRKNINIPIVGIGGLNEHNIKKLIYFKPDFLAFCSAIWNTKNKPQHQIKRIKNVLDNF